MPENTIEKTHSYHPITTGIEIKDLAFMKSTPEVYSLPHCTEVYHLLWIKEGTLSCLVDFEEISLTAGEVLLIIPGQVCVYNLDSCFIGSAVLFVDPFCCQTDENASFLEKSEILSTTTSLKKIHFCPEVLANLFSLLERELNRKTDDLSCVMAHNYLRTLLLEGERSIKETSTVIDSRLVWEFQWIVNTYCKTHKNSSYYCSILGVSEKVLSKSLKMSTGYTPKVYIDQRLILEAKRMLSYSNESIKHVCYSLGFDEPTNFSKFFRKHTKLTPQAFRDLQQGRKTP